MADIPNPFKRVNYPAFLRTRPIETEQEYAVMRVFGDHVRFDRSDPAYGTCFPTVKTIMEETHMSRTLVMRALRGLIDRGVIERKKQSNRQGQRQATLTRIVTESHVPNRHMTHVLNRDLAENHVSKPCVISTHQQGNIQQDYLDKEITYEVSNTRAGGLNRCTVPGCGLPRELYESDGCELGKGKQCPMAKGSGR